MKPRPSSAPPLRIHTTAELARHVGLSRATVSRILNGHGGIKQKNIDRVMEVVRQTGFSPNPYSNMLRDRRSGTIAVCISSFKFPAVVLKLARVVQIFVKAGYTVIVESAEHVDHADIRKWILRLRAEAVVFVGQFQGPALAAHVQDLGARGVPHVFCNDMDDPAANVVTLDRPRGMAELTNHLLDLGHRRIGLIGIEGDVPFVTARLRGLRRALTKRGLDPTKALVRLEHPPVRASNMLFGREVARRFAAEPKLPTAFAALNDEVAFGAIEGFRTAGLRVPRDVSIVGFDNVELAAVASPSITTIDGMLEDSAGAAVEFLLEQLRGQKPVAHGVKRWVRPKLLVRESTGPARKS